MPSATNTATDTLVEILSHLIKFPTVATDEATCIASLDWVEQQLSGLPLRVQRYQHNGSPSLVAVTSGAKNPASPAILLVAHMDVVPAPASAFVPRLENGRLYGRGAHDMKFALAAFLTLLKDLGPDLVNCDLGLMVTCDEEVGGHDGVKYLIEQQHYQGGVAIIPDSGGNWRMEVGSKGVMWWQLAASGTSSHASRPWDGDNAIDKLVRFINHIRAHFPTEPCENNHNHSTFNVGQIAGGTAANLVPDAATAKVDIRYTPDLDLSTVVSWFDDAQKAVPGVSAEMLIGDPPYRIAMDSQLERFRSIVRDVTGHDVSIMTSHGSSDARHFAKYNIQTINVCPTGSGFHVADEWIDIADLELFYRILKRYIVTHEANRT